MASIDVKSAFVGALVFAIPTIAIVLFHKGKKSSSIVNKANLSKVTTISIEELTETKYLCRCWQSANYPYCDGSHKKYNEETGDSLGPLVLKK
jgi:CDGSH-type Zn-finger protein